jgi:hypothetical protein
MKGVIIFLLLGALIVGAVGCSSGGPTIFGGYTITISSTLGGKVTTPGEGLFQYSQGTVVDLVAEPDRGYHFVSWTSNARDIADVYSPTTAITMNQNYCFLIASFEAN